MSTDNRYNPSTQAGFFITDKWDVFDNHYASQVIWRDAIYPTSEHAYQAGKFLETAPDIAEKVRSANSPRMAAVFANEHKEQRHPEWDSLKVSVMEEVIATKAAQHEFIRTILTNSGNLQIVEMNYDDEFWGWGKNQNGRNELGKVWMRLRQQLRNVT